MESKFKTLSKNHSDRDGDWIPEFDDGIDRLSVRMPDGKKYSRFALVKDCFLGDCRVVSAPRYGATGNLTFKVNWNYASMGKANYDLKIYAVDEGDDNVPLIISFGSHNWEEKAKGAINAGRHVKIRVGGPQALLLYPLIWGGRSRDLLNSEGDNGSREGNGGSQSREVAIAITAIICVTIASVLVFATLAALIMYATQKGLCSKAKKGGDGSSLNGINTGGVEIDIHTCAEGRELMIHGLRESEMSRDDETSFEEPGLNGGQEHNATRFDAIERKLEMIVEAIEDLKKKEMATGLK